MGRGERDRSIEREREAKLELVRVVLVYADCVDLYELITAERAERLHDAMMDRVPRAVAATIVGWAETMATDPAPGSVRYTEGWNASLEALARRIRREYSL